MKKLSIILTILLIMSLILTLSLILPLIAGKSSIATIPMSDTETISVGAVENNTYWNESISLGCTLDEDWYFLTMEEILEVNGYAFGQLEGEIGERLQNAENFTCMNAINLETNATVNVGIEKLNVMHALALSEKKYAEISVDTLLEALGQMGAENLNYEIIELEIDGEKHAGIQLSFQNEETDVYELLGIIKKGNCMIVISTATFGENTCAEIMSSFTRTAPKAK